MNMLCWMCGKTRQERVRVAPIVKKDDRNSAQVVLVRREKTCILCSKQRCSHGD